MLAEGWQQLLVEMEQRFKMEFGPLSAPSTARRGKRCRRRTRGSSSHQIPPVVNRDKPLQFSKKNVEARIARSLAEAAKRQYEQVILCLIFQVHLGECSRNECMSASCALTRPCSFILVLTFHLVPQMVHFFGV